jgi:hypothetical protein
MTNADGIGQLGTKLRHLVSDLQGRSNSEFASQLHRQRLVHLGEILLLAADMADDLDGLPSSLADASPDVISGVFDDLVIREWPDGTQRDQG